MQIHSLQNIPTVLWLWTNADEMWNWSAENVFADSPYNREAIKDTGKLKHCVDNTGLLYGLEEVEVWRREGPRAEA